MKSIHLAVNGTLMRGLELNSNLTDIGGQFVRETTTAPSYRLWSIEDRHPAMMKACSGGTEIHVEIWEVPVEGVVTIILKEPPGLCVGRITLVDGEEVLGVLAEPILCEGMPEITRWGGWRTYIATKTEPAREGNSS